MCFSVCNIWTLVIRHILCRPILSFYDLEMYLEVFSISEFLVDLILNWN